MIDLRSDTITKPTQEMRDAMYTAEVGDDVYGEDPTVNRLEEIAANLLGKERALFVTSGTQGNQVAILSHTKPGEEIILEAESHIFYYEAAAASALAGVQSRTIKGNRGQMPIEDINKAIRDEDIHLPRTALIALENTHNRAGGAILPPNYMENVSNLAKEKNIPIHLDGARLLNASVALQTDVANLTKYVDSVQICLSKGLSAPMGSILAGSEEFISIARKWRKRLGGGMRQAGIMAAAGIISLTEMVERLDDDHKRAKKLAEGLSNINGLTINPDFVETNIVLFDTKDLGVTAKEFLNRLNNDGLLGAVFDEYLIRLTTHREISDKDIEDTLAIVSKLAKKY